MRRKFKVFEQLKSLLEKLVFCNQMDLLFEQLNRVTKWLNEKLTSCDSTSAMMAKKLNEEMAKKV